MLTKLAFQRLFVTVFLTLLGLNVSVKIVAYTIMRQTGRTQDEGSAVWSSMVGDAEEVLLEIDSWTRYTLFSPLEWQPLFPGGGVVHLGPDREPFTVAMMHQLRCLDVVRDQLSRVKVERDEEPTRHCMNYLRQMLQCRGDVQLDAYQYAHQVSPLHPHALRRCKDWRVVYDKVADNQRLTSTGPQ